MAFGMLVVARASMRSYCSTLQFAGRLLRRTYPYLWALARQQEEGKSLYWCRNHVTYDAIIEHCLGHGVPSVVREEIRKIYWRLLIEVEKT